MYCVVLCVFGVSEKEEVGRDGIIVLYRVCYCERGGGGGGKEGGDCVVLCVLFWLFGVLCGFGLVVC